MSIPAAAILALYGLTEAEHTRGWKDVSLTMADGKVQPVRLRRYGTHENNFRALNDYAISGDAAYLLQGMLGEIGTPTFFASLAPGELTRLANLAVPLLFSVEFLEQAIASGLQETTKEGALQLVTEAVGNVVREYASHEGGFHG